MTRLLLIGALFLLAGLREISGGYLVWGWPREGSSRPSPGAPWWTVSGPDLLGALIRVAGVLVMVAPQRG